MTTLTFRRVYVWEWPVRMYHWVTVACMAVLVATGLLIGTPLALMSSREAADSYWFGVVRVLHFSAGFVFFYAFLFRVYWMFAGNEHASWRAFFPVTPKLFMRQFREVFQVLKIDILQVQVKPVDYVGHNALAALSYGILFLCTIFISATGFALYSQMSRAWVPALFGWIVPLMGGDASVRFWHHVATWFFVYFTIVHVYLAVFHEGTEAKGEISSIISGTRFLDKP